jgi:hypothetical protein
VPFHIILFTEQIIFCSIPLLSFVLITVILKFHTTKCENQTNRVMHISDNNGNTGKLHENQFETALQLLIYVWFHCYQR